MQNVIQHLSETGPFRHTNLRTVRRIAESRLPTEFGDFQIIGYRSLTSAEEFIALVKGVSRPALLKKSA